MQMGNLDAELQQHRAFAPCLAKEDPFGFAVYTRVMRELPGLEPGHVLDMTFPDHHGVAGNAPLGGRGRKTDISDAHWIAKLLRHGLIRPSFVPPRPIRQLRQMTRYRRKLVQTRTSAELRVEKLLQ